MTWAEQYPWASRCWQHPDALYERAQSRPRSEWGDGPWQDEPDLVCWTTQAGLPGLIWRSPLTGALCGYAGVALCHPYFGKHWKAIELGVEVHGGLTFSGQFEPELVELEPEWQGKWWLGFDCSHAFDLSPALIALLRDLRHPRHWARLSAEGREVPTAPLAYETLFGNDQYWTVQAVHAEVEALAAELVAAGNPGVQDVLDGVRAGERAE